MADKKISQLSSATTPLAGTETLPIVQSSSTVKVAVSDLTAGRNVAVGAAVGVPRTLSVGGSVAIERFNATPQIAIRGGTDATVGQEYRFSLTQANGLYISNAVIGGSQLENWFFRTNGDLEVKSGNLVIGTAGKGIDFSATTNAAGMTSELLNDYEEGTFTPAVQFGVGNTGMTFSTQTGVYTRIGRLVTIHVTLVFTAKGSSTGAFRFSLPFTSATKSSGTMGFNYAWATMPSGGITFMTDGAYAYAMAANFGSYMDDTYFNDVTGINAITITYPV